MELYFFLKLSFHAKYKQKVFFGAGGGGGGAEAKRYYRGQVANTSCEIWVLYVYVFVLFNFFKKLLGV